MSSQPSNPVAIHTGANWKNVNNWHWIDKDCTTWAHDRIKSLLNGLHLEKGKFSVTKVVSIDGDAIVIQRKGTIKQVFDMEISFEYTQGDQTGSCFISNFTADYGTPSDLSIKLTPKIGSIQDELIQALNGLIVEFKTDLYNVHGKPLLVDSADSSSCKPPAEAKPVASSNAPQCTTQEATEKAKMTTTPSTKTSIEDEVNFPCPAEQLYLMLTDPSRIRAWSRSQANLPQIILPQAPFSLFDGNITGKFLMLTPPSLIEMEWKLKSWESPSKVSISIRPDPEGPRSILLIKQSNVPSGEAEITKNNWHKYYWNPIKQAFGVIL